MHQLLCLSAWAEEECGRVEEAAADYRKVLVDYPQSPLVVNVRLQLERLEGE